MIKLTERDYKILEFLEIVEVADTNTIHKMYFSCLRSTQSRLKKLVDHGYIRSYRPDILSQNIYYLKRRPINWKHKIIFSQLLGELNVLGVELHKYKTPYSFELTDGRVIADGLVIFTLKGELYIWLVEVERTNKKLDKGKYERLYYSRKLEQLFPFTPTIICISDKKIETKHDFLKIKACKLDLSNIENLFK